MRSLLLIALVACGGAPAFVPVTVTLGDDAFYADGLIVTFSKKLNASCTSNCEMGQAVEDGGSVFQPFLNAIAGPPPYTSPVKQVAPGAEVAISWTPANEPCSRSFAVPASSFNISIGHDGGACVFSTR